MRITVITGTGVKGCTWHIKELFLKLIRDEKHEITEFTLPNDFSHFCLGCKTCFNRSEEQCPHYADFKPIYQAMLEAELIVFAYPVYCMRAPGQVKALLDHLGFQWFAHRPDPKMFSKRAVILTNSIGAPNGPAQKDVKTSLNWMGVGSVKCYAFPLMEGVVWNELSQARRDKITRTCEKAAKHQLRMSAPTGLNLKGKIYFNMCRMMQRKLQKEGRDTADLRHWQKHGWV